MPKFLENFFNKVGLNFDSSKSVGTHNRFGALETKFGRKKWYRIVFLRKPVFTLFVEISLSKNIGFVFL